MFPDVRFSEMEKEKTMISQPLATAQLEDCTDVQIGPRLHYHAPIVINQNFVTDRKHSTNRPISLEGTTNYLGSIKRKSDIPSASNAEVRLLKKHILSSVSHCLSQYTTVFLLLLLLTAATVTILLFIEGSQKKCFSAHFQIPKATMRLQHLQDFLIFLRDELSNINDTSNWTSLIDVLNYDNEAVLEVFLDTGIEMNTLRGASKKYYSYSALHYAARKDKVSSAKVLIRRGANISERTRDKYGFTPLHIAVEYGNTDMVTYLLDVGAPVDIGNKYGTTPLMKAVERNRSAIVDILLDKNAQANVGNCRGVTPLHSAAIHGYSYIVLQLIRRGADVNATTSDTNQTPLHFAASKCELSAMKTLLEGHADIRLRDFEHSTAFDLAMKRSNKCNVTQFQQLFYNYTKMQ